MQDQRFLDTDDVRVFNAKSVMGKGRRLKVVDPFPSGGEIDADGWQVMNADKLKKRLKRTIIQELSRKDVMQDDRARLVSQQRG